MSASAINCILLSSIVTSSTADGRAFAREQLLPITTEYTSRVDFKVNQCKVSISAQVLEIVTVLISWLFCGEYFQDVELIIINNKYCVE